MSTEEKAFTRAALLDAVAALVAARKLEPERARWLLETHNLSESRLVALLERLSELPPKPPWWRFFALRRWRRAYVAITAMGVTMFDEMNASVYNQEYLTQLANRSNFIDFARIRKVKR